MEYSAYDTDEEFFGKEEKEKKEKRHKWITFACRTAICALGILGVSIMSFSPLGLASKEPYCIEDSLFSSTKSINDYLNKSENKGVVDFMLIFSSVLLDLQLLVTLVLWLKNGKKWTPILAVIFIFLLKLLSNMLFNIKYPDGMLFYYPGFPSISVSYTKTSTFFFSLNAGISTIFSILAYEMKHKVICFIGFVIVFIYSITSIFLRFHFLIDLFSGILCAFYVYYITEYPAKLLEKLVQIKGDSEYEEVNK